jgi:hypothetical protein
MAHAARTLCLCAVGLLGFVGCGSTGDSDAPVLEQARGARLFELRQAVAGDGAPVASNNYFCAPCSTDEAAAAAFETAELPNGFVRSPLRILEAARATLFAPLNTRGAPLRMSLLDEVAGDESVLGAQPLGGAPVPDGGLLITIESTRRLEWDAGDTLVELSDGEHTYVLFAQEREPGTPSPTDMALPDGWSRTTRTLGAPFTLEPVPHVLVFLHLTSQHLWQRVIPP